MVAILSLIGATVFGLLSVRYGVEQRPGFDGGPELR